jgi:hypothetical protein
MFEWCAMKSANMEVEWLKRGLPPQLTANAVWRAPSLMRASGESRRMAMESS